MTGDRMSRIRLTVGQALVRYLQAQFSERDGDVRRLIPAMLGIFGHGNVGGLGDALYACAGDLPYLQVRNEQSMVHQAAGFAKAHKRAATLACTSSIGPGSTNMITGAAGAHFNRLPVLLLPADTYATRHQGIVMQQLEYPIAADVSVNDCFRPVSRFFDRITRPEQLLTALPEAMRVLTSPVEVGPVTIALPQDVLTHAYDYPAAFFARRTWRIERPQPDPRRVAEALSMIAAATRPVIIAGGGVNYAEAQADLAAFAKLAGIPVVETFAGKGAVQEDAWFAVGGVGSHGNPAAAQVVRTADLVICIGTRLIDTTTGSQSLFAHPDVRFISINVTDRDARKQGALPLVADAREALRALLAAAKAAPVRSNDAYQSEVAQLKERWLAQRRALFEQAPGELMSQAQLVGVLNEAARPGDTVVTAAGTPPGDLLQLWDATGNRYCDLEYGNSCMGYEIPAGIGIRMARPDGEVYVLVGDGTYLMNPTELVTARQEGWKITVIISDNHGYQSVHRVQMKRAGLSFGNEFRMRDPATNRLEGEVVPLDLAATAAGFGARTFTVDTPDRLRAALEEARAQIGPCVIVAETEMYRRVADSTVWWDIAPAEVSSHEGTRQARVEYERMRAEIQRFHG